MCSTMRLLLVVGVLAIAGFGVSAAQAGEQAQQTQTQAQTQGQDQWRYTLHNGEWWYWLPAGRWVYWRDNRWNDYDPKTFTGPASSGVVVTEWGGIEPRESGCCQLGYPPILWPCSISSLDRRPLQEDNEVGPFYGHALPSEVFGGGRGGRSIRPFYGHAVSSDGD